MTYTPPAGDLIEFDLTGTYSVPDGDAIEFELGASGPAPLPVKIGGGYALPWGDMARKETADQLPWSAIDDVPGPMLDVTWSDMHRLSDMTALPWAGLDAVETSRLLPWARTTPVMTGDELPWRSRPYNNREVVLPWDAGTWRPVDIVAPFGAGQRIDPEWVIPWAMMVRMIANDIIDAWIALTAQDIRRKVLWGRKYYEEICLRRYQVTPGDMIAFNIHQPIEETDDKDHIIFRMESLSYDLRCGQREPSGRRDKYIIPPAIPTPIIVPVIILMDTVLVKRISDNLPIEVHNIEISGDLNSWCWSFSGQVKDRSTLETVWPVGLASPVEIEVEINGWKFQFAVEGYGEDLRFPGGTWRIHGRSRSVTLADPYGAVRSYVSSADRQAVQLANDELQYTGWTVDWSAAVNWLVKSGSFSYENKTKMAAIQQLAAAIGAVVQTHRYSSELIVIPRHRVSAWDWAAATPAMELTHAILDTVSRDWVRLPPVNRVFVAGADANGVRVRVTRDGTAGDILSPMISDRLITHQDAGRERGRQILSAGGNFDRVRFATFLKSSGTLPELIPPGTMLRLVEPGDTWIGQSSGVMITTHSQDGAVVVGQVVTVERKH